MVHAKVIKGYCLNVVVDINPIYLKKHYLFQNWFMLTIVIKAYCVNAVVDIKAYFFEQTLFFSEQDLQFR